MIWENIPKGVGRQVPAFQWRRSTRYSAINADLGGLIELLVEGARHAEIGCAGSSDADLPSEFDKLVVPRSAQDGLFGG